MKKIITCVSNDLSTDQRVHKIALTLTNELKYEVLAVGRKFASSPKLDRPYSTKRFRLLINKGPFFYMCLNFRLFTFLLFKKVDIIVSNDLDTLPGCALASKFKSAKLYYDSHELFTEVPELVNRKRIQRIWEKLEKKYIKKVSKFYTVCQPIAEIYANKYNKKVHVVRNVPLAKDSNISSKFETPTLIYQGALNLGRGIELMIDTMKFLPNFNLLIVGKGDLEYNLKTKVKKLDLLNVQFKGFVSFSELHHLTSKCHIGLSWEENLGLNYYYALPNKVFDYIQARIPVLVSNLPGLKSIIDENKVGDVLESTTSEKIAVQIERLFEKRYTFDDSLESAAQKLTWEKEQQILLDIYTS